MNAPTDTWVTFYRVRQADGSTVLVQKNRDGDTRSVVIPVSSPLMVAPTP